MDANPERRALAFKADDRWFLLLLGAIYMFNFIDRTVIAVLGEAIRRDMTLTDLQLGMLGGFAFSLFYAVLGIPLARLAERFSRIRIITAVTILWSLMTALSAAAVTYLQLLVCRMAVGVGEAGFTPALVSMISDRFDRGRRALAFSLIAVGVPMGGAVGAIGAGWVADAFGWRVAFVVAGAPGLLLALLLIATIPEPTRTDAGDSRNTPPFRSVLHRVGRSRAFLNLTCGSGFVGLVGFGTNLFLIPLLVRRYGLSLPQAGLVFALSFSLATMVGQVGGGVLIGPLIRRDVRWGGWAPAIATGVALPWYVIALNQSDWRGLVGLMFVATALLYAFTPAIMTVVQSLVEPRMRASAAALHAFGQTVGGLGLGSVALGFLSDRLAAALYRGDYPAECLSVRVAPNDACLAAAADGLRLGMQVTSIVLVIAVANYLFAARALLAQAGEQHA